MSNKSHHHEPGHPTVGHVSPLPQLFMVFGALVALTILTVALSGKLPGASGMMIAMGIATVKALLVALYFMHLRYDRPFNGYIFLAGILFVAVFFGFASLDTATYRRDIIPYEADKLGAAGGSQEAMYEEPRKAYQNAHQGKSLHTSESGSEQPAADGEDAGAAAH
ncbi:cytochrome C oxidase subunit IV family protein [bacterium]|nr:cytochrome C oxidase subunit IV family protein [bacterium]